MSDYPNHSSVASTKRRVIQIWLHLRHEPLIHFLGIAALLFVFNAAFNGDEREVISVDVATQEYIIKQRQELLLRPLSKEEKIEAIDAFIEDEILVREAQKRTR